MNVRRAPERLQVRANRLWIWAIITQPVFSFGLCRPSAVVGTEHSLRVRRRHAAARPAVPVRQKGKSCRCSAAGHHDLAAESGQLRSGGCCAGHRHGNHHRRTKHGVQLTGIIVSVTALCCLNGLSHLLSLPADTLLFATLPTLVFPLMALSLSIHLCPEGCPRFMPRHFFYIAYIGHLLVLLLLMHLW